MKKFALPITNDPSEDTRKLCQSILDADQFDQAAEIFRQLSDPTRVRIFWLLSRQEECVTDISSILHMSSPAVSHHLKSLTECGLITRHRNGKEVQYYAADTKQCKMLHIMLEHLLNLSGSENSGEQDSSPADTARLVHEYMMAHLGERITIEQLSRKFLINPTTLKRVYKEIYGESLAAHIRRKRMEQASELLLDTQDSIASIARKVGYENQSRFTSAFKGFFGILPTDYKKMAQHVNPEKK